MRDEDDLAAHHLVRRGLELGLRIEPDDFARDALRPGRGAVAERRDHQLLRKGRENGRGLRSACPHRHVERLDPDIGKAHRLQLSHRPFACPGLGLGPGHPLADLCRQSFDDVPGIFILECTIAKVGDIGGDGLRERRSGGRD